MAIGDFPPRMPILERIAWRIVAYYNGVRLCSQGHAVANDTGGCFYCVKWCDGCGHYVPRWPIHWPHPKPSDLSR